MTRVGVPATRPAQSGLARESVSGGVYRTASAFAHRLASRSLLLGLLPRRSRERRRRVGAIAAEFQIQHASSAELIHQLGRTRILFRLLGRSRRAAETLVLRMMTGSTRDDLPPAEVRFNRDRGDSERENVLLVVHEASRTGAPILGWNIGARLSARYNLFTVLLGGGSLVKVFRDLSVATYGPFAQSRPSTIAIDCALRSMFDERAFKYALINSCESRSAIQVCSSRGIPTVFLMHEFGSCVYPPDSLRAAFDMASEVVFPAQMVADSSIEVHPSLDRRPITVLPQGLSILPAASASPNASATASALETLAHARRQGAFVVLGAGTVDFRKGVDVFLSTAMAIRREAFERPVHFLWVGHGYRPKEDMAYSIYLHEQMARAGLRDCVTLLDETSDLEPVYRTADVFLLASRLDPMPNVSIDAAHRGIPVVCFKLASGMASLLQADRETTCTVVDYLDTAAAARAILALARDANHYARVSAATRRLARSVFDMEAYVDALDALGVAASAANPRRQLALCS